MIRSAIRTLVFGTDLRHVPVALRLDDLPIVRTWLMEDGRAIDITGLDVPASLKPLMIGIRETAAWPHAESRCWRLEVRLPNDGVVGSMELAPAGRVTLGAAAIALFRPLRARTACVGMAERSWRYFLAWRRVRASVGSPGLSMTAADLRALDVYYQRPRPVWLVSVPHDVGFNMFPMDLLENFNGNRLFLALRSSSPSVRFMRQRCPIALSAVPAILKQAIYKLGAHHKVAHTPSTPLPFPTIHSARHGLIVPAPAFRVTEWVIDDWAEVGSHTCFVATRVDETNQGPAAQLAHVSELFAQSTRAVHEPFVAI